MVTLQEIQERANELSTEDRGKLAAFLLRSLPEPRDDVSDEEVARRASELDSGDDPGMSLDELRQAVRDGRGQ